MQGFQRQGPVGMGKNDDPPDDPGHQADQRDRAQEGVEVAPEPDGLVEMEAAGPLPSEKSGVKRKDNGRELRQGMEKKNHIAPCPARIVVVWLRLIRSSFPARAQSIIVPFLARGGGEGK